MRYTLDLNLARKATLTGIRITDIFKKKTNEKIDVRSLLSLQHSADGTKITGRSEV
jgi:hypothetical protein